MQQPFVSSSSPRLILVCLAFTVCGAGCAASAPPQPDAQRLLVRFWEQPSYETVGRPVNPGVDLDGHVGVGASDRCDDALDYERDGAPGIDNGYAALLVLLGDSDLGGTESGVPTAVPVQLQAGEGLYGFDVEPPPADDPTGPVYITLLSFAASAPLEVDDRLRLEVTAELTATPIERVVATYAEDRWRAEFASLAVPMGPVLGLRPVRGVVVEFEIADGRFVRADLGARVSMDTAVAVGVAATGESEEIIRDLLDSISVADMEPNADGSACDAISFGVGLELIALPD